MLFLISTPEVDLIKDNTSQSKLVEWIERILDEYKTKEIVDIEWLKSEGFTTTSKTEFIPEAHLCYEVADGKILSISTVTYNMDVEDFIQRAKEILTGG